MFKMTQLTLCMMLIVCVGIQGQAQQSSSKLDAKITSIRELQKRLNYHAKDFIDFSRHNGNGTEYSISVDLYYMATRAQECLHAANSILQIYDLITCETDRSKIKPLIKMELRDSVRGIEMHVKQVNDNLAFTKVPAVATSGTKLKEDLREAIALLESIELQ